MSFALVWTYSAGAENRLVVNAEELAGANLQT